MRRPDRERKDVKLDSSLPISPVEVMADEAQLEQALLTMLVHAEHAAGHSTDRTVRISTRVLGKKVQFAMDCTLGSGTDPFTEVAQGDYFGLPVAQAIAQSHGGDLRLVPGRSGFRLELEMPIHTPVANTEKSAGASQRPLRVITALIVEPDMTAQRKLLTMLGGRGHRAIPAATAEDAADLVQRMAFDVVFCAVRLPGLNWVELFQRVRRRVGAFALLTEGYDSEAARAFKGGEGQILPKPIDDRALDNFLALVDVRHAAARR
jgi:CheY-like chemotaxis protein